MRLSLRQVLIVLAVVAASVTYALFMHQQLQSVKQTLQAVEKAQRAQTELSKENLNILHKLDVAERKTNERVVVIREDIRNAEGADQTVPTDVARAWAAGIDSLRNDANERPDPSRH